jgi:glycosyltransferase involved in cell wall biosynthesis
VKAGSVVVGYMDDGGWSASFGVSFRDTCLVDQAGPQRITKELRKYTGTGGIVASRNQIAASFLDDTDGEWLWMVDTDMGFAPDALERLLEQADPTDAPVMGGLCFALKRDGVGEGHAQRFKTVPTAYSYHEYPAVGEVGFKPIYDYPRDAVIEVAGTGAAFLVVHRSAFEKVRAKHGDTWFDPMTHPVGDKGGPRTFSEDLSFCIRLASVDVPIRVDTGVRTSHEKGGIYLTQDSYDRERAIASLGSEPRISILVPTRGRPESLVRLVGSAVQTAAGPVEFVFYVDDDDQASADALDVMAHLNVRYIRGERVVLSEMWNRCAEKANADVMMHCGDDIIFRTPGWDVKVLAEFAKHPDGIVLVHGNDLFQGGNLATHGFLHRRWVEAVGHFVPPYFSSDYNDTWLTAVADEIGRRVYLPDVVTEHLHPLAGKGEWDLTHRERLERHQKDDVGALYASLAYERANDVAKLRAVMS